MECGAVVLAASASIAMHVHTGVTDTADPKLQALVYDNLQPLPYLVTSEVPENCQLTSSFSFVLKQ